MPVVKVTDGPTVAKSVNVDEVVLCSVSILADALAGDELAGVCHFNPVASALSATNPGTISEDCAKGDYSRINTIVPRQRTIPKTRINFYYGTNTARNN